MNKKYSVLLADLDNTLLDFSASERIAISRLLEHYGGATEKALIDYPSYNDSLWKRLEKGEITRDQLVKTRFAGFFKRHGINGDGGEAAFLYQKYLSESAIWMDGAEELLLKCRGKIKVYVISNGIATVQLPRVRSSGIDKLTDGHFISEIIGYNKPDIRYFEAVSGKIPGFDRDKTLVLGDSLTADIAGGKAFGCDTCLFDKDGKYNVTENIKPYLLIRKLSELYKILDI
ncbi:MAG: YjjG family noncanonical pyrimidine nucleotidase [Clostridia bacterium]|nr:YjjG family noncanonical pyrimidine nucleotidase [Clostridia bacterium]